MQLRMPGKGGLAMLAFHIPHVALTQSMLHEHVVEYQSGTGAEPLATVKAIAHHLLTAILRQLWQSINESPLCTQRLHAGNFHVAIFHGEVLDYINLGCQEL